MSYQTISVEIRNQIGILALNRPEVHNAFNEVMIAELNAACRVLDRNKEVRVVVLIGAGKNFSAGADLNWMKKMAAYSLAQNRKDALALARMLHSLNNLSKPTIARVQGAAYGGGVGLISCCDMAVAANDALFGTTETKLGLIPATISPYVIAAIGERQARRYFLTAERFTAAEAFRIGLLHDIVPAEELDNRVNEWCATLLEAGPQAQAAAKDLIRAVRHRAVNDKLLTETAERIAKVRASQEGKEGVDAFLAKRKPAWAPS